MKNSIFDIENWKEIGVTLARNKTRTFLTAFGIFWGTAMLAMLLGGAQGLESLMRRNFDGFATNSGMIFSGRTTLAYKGYNKGRYWNLTIKDARQIRRVCPEIDALSCVDFQSATASYGMKSTSISIQGVDEDFSRIFLPIVYDGRFINASDDAQSRKVCAIGKTIAENLFSGKSPVNEFVKIGEVYYKVVGVVGQQSEIRMNARMEESVVIPGSTLRRSFNNGDKVGGMLFSVRQGSSPSDVETRVRRIISNNNSIHPDDKSAIGFSDISESFKVVDNLFMGITILALFVGVGSLLAGIIGVGNIMWVIVKERTQEIGIRRAIGAKPRDIIAQILSESVVLTVVAGVAGICFAVLVLGVAQLALSTPTYVADFQLEFIDAVKILLTFVILGTVVGTIPARKAMNIKPIEAMNDK